jgi:hypothetical protein
MGVEAFVFSMVLPDITRCGWFRLRCRISRVKEKVAEKVVSLSGASAIGRTFFSGNFRSSSFPWMDEVMTL